MNCSLRNVLSQPREPFQANINMEWDNFFFIEQKWCEGNGKNTLSLMHDPSSWWTCHPHSKLPSNFPSFTLVYVFGSVLNASQCSSIFAAVVKGVSFGMCGNNTCLCSFSTHRISVDEHMEPWTACCCSTMRTNGQSSAQNVCLRILRFTSDMTFCDCLWHPSILVCQLVITTHTSHTYACLAISDMTSQLCNTISRASAAALQQTRPRTVDINWR